MLGSAISAWLLSGVFAVALGCSLVAAAGATRSARSSWVARIDAGWHIAADAAMIGMLWTWGAALPTIGLILFFTAGGLWFAGLDLYPMPGAPCTRVTHAWDHAVMMVAMAVMAGVMAAYQTPSVGSPGGTSTADMPGMDQMSGMAGMTGTSGSATTAAPATGWLFVVCLAATAALIVIAGRILMAAVRPGPAEPDRQRSSSPAGVGDLRTSPTSTTTAPPVRRRSAVVGAAGEVLMAGGMAVAFLQLAQFP